MSISLPTNICKKTHLDYQKKRSREDDLQLLRTVKLKPAVSSRENHLCAFIFENFSLFQPFFSGNDASLIIPSGKENPFKNNLEVLHLNAVIISKLSLTCKALCNRNETYLANHQTLIKILTLLNSNWEPLNQMCGFYDHQLSMYVMKLLNSVAPLKIPEPLQGTIFPSGAFSYIEDLTCYGIHLFLKNKADANSSLLFLLRTISKLQSVYLIAYLIETLDRSTFPKEGSALHRAVSKIVRDGKIVQQIQELSVKNGAFLLPGGHAEHGVLYHFQGKSGQIQFTIINTGEGAPKDYLNKRNYTYDIRYTHLRPEDFPEEFICQLLFWQLSKPSLFKVNSQNEITVQIHQQLNKGNNLSHGRRHHRQRPHIGGCLGKCIASFIREELPKALLQNFKVFLTKRELNKIACFIKDSEKGDSEKAVLKQLLCVSNTQEISLRLLSFQAMGEEVLIKRQSKADQLNASKKNTRSNPKIIS